jgi:hypothetical protein
MARNCVSLGVGGKNCGNLGQIARKIDTEAFQYDSDHSPLDMSRHSKQHVFWRNLSMPPAHCAIAGD